MSSTAQIAYPAFADEEKEATIEEDAQAIGEREERIEDRAIQEDKEPDYEPEDEKADEEAHEGSHLDDDIEGCPVGAYIHEESGRSFDISPEEFCANRYEMQDDRETRMELGRKGEEAAVRYLLSKGYDILRRNWFCYFGEADIIAYDPDGALCFIEVKTRKNIEAGFPEEAITKDKQRRYERIALAYMMAYDDCVGDEDVRFDAICICVTGPHRAMLRHHKGCFDASI